MKNIFRIHAIQRMFERGISVEDVRAALEGGEILEHYADAAYPGRLIFIRRGNPGAPSRTVPASFRKGKRPLHIVAVDSAAGGETIIITGYQPDRARWTEDFKRRRDEVPDL